MIEKSTGKVWYESGGEDEDASKPFYIKLKPSADTPDGEYKLLLEVTTIMGRKFSQSWSFYHKGL